MRFFQFVRLVLTHRSFPQTFAPTATGFRTRICIWQALMLAFVSPDLTAWNDSRIRKMPKWSGEFYDFDGVVSKSDVQSWQNQGPKRELLRSALRNALKDRCKLRIHETPAERPNLLLVTGGSGLRVKAAASNCVLSPSFKLASGGTWGLKKVDGVNAAVFCNATLEDLASYPNNYSYGVPVRNATGATAHFDFTVQRVEEIKRDSQDVYRFDIGRLGLKLKSGKENQPVFVIDYIERPSAN